MKKVSVIIVNYNTKLLTKQCVDSVICQTKDVDYEIIVVDNASSDGSKELFENNEQIRYIYSDVNLGFGKANNLAYKYSTGQYIFLLNSDTILLNDAISRFVMYFDNYADTNVACLGTILKQEDGITENNSYSEFPSISSNIKFFISYYCQTCKNLDNAVTSSQFQVDYVIGADLFIKRSVIDRLGLFDPSFFMYFEDSELQFRYSKNGYKSMIISGPQIIHLEGASSIFGTRLIGKKARMYFNGMLTYMGKRYSGLKYLIARVVMFGFIPMMVYNKTFNLIPSLFKSKSFFNSNLYE